MAEILLSAAEAAEIAGCHKDTIRRAVHFGLLKAQMVGKVFAISPENLKEWIEAGMPNHRRKSTRKTKTDTQPPESSGNSDD